jgi:hypothetical protein
VFFSVFTRTDLAVGLAQRAEKFYRVMTESPNRGIADDVPNTFDQPH